MGPSFVGAGFTSGNLIADVMNSKYPGLLHLAAPIVDVRDCAMMHL
jgi:hypothetical protein